MASKTATKTSPKHYFVYVNENEIDVSTIEYSDLYSSQKLAETNGTAFLDGESDEYSVMVYELVPLVKLTTSSDVVRTVFTTK